MMGPKIMCSVKLAHNELVLTTIISRNCMLPSNRLPCCSPLTLRHATLCYAAFLFCSPTGEGLQEDPRRKGQDEEPPLRHASRTPRHLREVRGASTFLPRFVPAVVCGRKQRSIACWPFDYFFTLTANLAGHYCTSIRFLFGAPLSRSRVFDFFSSTKWHVRFYGTCPP